MFDEVTQKTKTFLNRNQLSAKAVDVSSGGSIHPFVKPTIKLLAKA